MIEEINKLKIKYNTDFDLTNHNTMKLTSMCYLIVYPKDIQELKSVIDIIKKYNTKFFVLGNGSNIILPDYYDGVVIKLDNFKKMIFKNGNLHVEAGYMLNLLANKISNLGYKGLEWATGIPGTIGGALYGNAGAYKSSMKDIVDSVFVFDGNNIVELSNNDCKFEYRNSVFKIRTDLIILSCNIKVTEGNIKEIKTIIEERTIKRRETQDLIHPSCGSVFRNPINASAGKLIDDLGLKGYNIGDAKISNIHANFIINEGRATSKDVIKLIKKIKKDVKNTYNIDLVLEQEIIK